MKYSKWLRPAIALVAIVGLFFISTGAVRISPSAIAEMDGAPVRTTSGAGSFAYQVKIVGVQAETLRTCTSDDVIIVTWAHWFIRPADATSEDVIFSMFEGVSATDSLPGTFWVGAAPDSAGGTPQQLSGPEGQIYSFPANWRVAAAAGSSLVIKGRVSAGTDTLVFSCGGYEVPSE